MEEEVVVVKEVMEEDGGIGSGGDVKDVGQGLKVAVVVMVKEMMMVEIKVLLFFEDKATPPHRPQYYDEGTRPQCHTTYFYINIHEKKNSEDKE
ncbi:hypothetical protein Pmani_010123 [Petrolisthes manimaculis]|uniref:Uncharacterized protein n=1 Tax=Petrolisthes manimaculis TaxID=1843537 RepID=A0AAE1Q244_9EUCA|nr:hypothetical protein Pmani_010123 [Petrolisthes manimaculis]